MMKRCFSSNDDCKGSCHKIKRARTCQLRNGVGTYLDTNNNDTDYLGTGTVKRILPCSEFSKQPTASGPTINHLPTEILLHIFSFVGHEELACTVASVSTVWHSLAYDFTLWRQITLDGMGLPTNHLVDIVRSSPGLRSLSLYNRSDLNTILPEVIRFSPALECLELVCCRGAHNRKNVLAGSLVGVLKHCKKLDTLTVAGVNFRSCGFYRTLLCSRAGAKIQELRVVVIPSYREFQCLLDAREQGQLLFHDIDETFL